MVATTFDSVINEPNLYVNGMQLVWVDNATLSVTSGACRSNDNSDDLILNSAVTLDTTKTGLNGLDIGTLAVNESYTVWVLADVTGFNPTGIIASLSINDAPLSPDFNYAARRRIGYFITDSNPNIVSFVSYGINNERYTQYAAGIEVVTAGASTVFAGQDLCTPVMGIPRRHAGNSNLIGYFSAVGSSGTASFAMRPTGNVTAGVNNAPVVMANGGGMATMLIGVDGGSNPSIDYAISAGTVNLFVNGYYDSL